jgi:hypothetical protein
METELEKYFQHIPNLSKEDELILEITPVGDGTEKEVKLYTPIKYSNPCFNDSLIHFRFVSKKLDGQAIENIETGLVNLAEKGYNITYFNSAKNK